ncbi:proline-rich protein 4-like [Phragmites australis]|uniref:proline-rich protein 4-like n=1 Tax=Phragmites australis TaxID=29695 RepID=UPI002D782455|nr:proline-rich protein 4-like [Phragmites australis]
MAATPGGLVFVFCAAVMVVAVANAAAGEAEAAVVVGMAKCADCSRKNMKAEAVFKGLQVVIKCNNSHGEYESKAVGGLDNSGSFSIPLAADVVSSADCFAQLQSAEGMPCSGQEPSWIHPFSNGTFVALAGKTHYVSSQCSAAICAWIKEHIYDHIHNHKKHLYHFFHGSPSPAPAN